MSVRQPPTATVTYEYTAQAPDELSIREGDVVEIVTKDPSGWWTGRLNGKTGLFPGNYARETASGPLQTSRSNYPYGN